MAISDSNQDFNKLVNDSGFSQALLKILELRKERKILYGDKWKEDPDWSILAEIRQKYLRLEHCVLNELKKESKVSRLTNSLDNKLTIDQDHILDTLIDLSIYSLFLLDNFLSREGL